MATIFSVDVYNINGVPINSSGTPETFGFSPTACLFRPAAAGTKSGGGTSLYGIIQTAPSGSTVATSVGGVQYTVVQTVAQLKTLATA